MRMCATCPAFVAPKPLPDGVTPAPTIDPDRGVCHLNPKPEPKRSSDFCMQHPHLRQQMATKPGATR